MAANTNVPRQTRKETRALADFCFTNEVGLGAATINRSSHCSTATETSPSTAFDMPTLRLELPMTRSASGMPLTLLVLG